VNWQERGQTWSKYPEPERLKRLSLPLNNSVAFKSRHDLWNKRWLAQNPELQYEAESPDSGCKDVRYGWRQMVSII